METEESTNGTVQPNVVDQALEAAQDDPTRIELTGMLTDIPWVSSVGVEHEDEPLLPTLIVVRFKDRHGTGTEVVMKLMRRAGWKTNSVCFSRERLTFIETGYE